MCHKSLLAVALVTVANLFDLHAQSLQLDIQPRGSDLEVRWPGSMLLESGRRVYPIFQIEQSMDLQNWQPAGPVIKGGADVMSTLMRPGASRSFYRLGAQWERNAAQATATGGAEVFGYEAAFQRELQRLGQLSTAEFRSRYALTNEYLSAFSWDPTTALYWNRFAMDPLTNNAG